MEEIDFVDFENGRFSHFQRHMTLTLTLDRATWQTVVHQSSTSTYTSDFIRIGETFCGRTDVCMYGWTSRPTLLGQLRGVDPKKQWMSSDV